MANDNIVRIGLFTKKHNLTIAQFRDYWHYHHAAIASNMYGMLRYDQNHVVKKVDLGLAAETDRQCDGMSKIWFGNMQNQKSNDPETMTKLAADERVLFQTMELVVCNEKTYLQMDPGTPFVKYMCFFRRMESVSIEEFQALWAQLADLFMKIPGIVDYREDTVLERLIDNVQGDRQQKVENAGHAHPSWISATYNDVPIDGVSELYFRFSEQTAIDNIFDTPEGKAAAEFAKTFIKHADCFLCDVHYIVNK